MAVRIYESQYKDQAAVTIESETLRAQFLPGVGAKMASLSYKPRGMELLVQAPGATYLHQPFDGDYVAGECSGLDDMFPTIDTCYYDRFPWQGTRMADHGEVWSLPWEMRAGDDSLCFAVHGVRFPYRLEKRVRFAEDSILRLDYCLTNLSPYPFDCLWAAHMMINLEEDTELLLPDGIQGITGTFGVKGDLAYGAEYAWPVGALPDGSQRDWRRLRPRSARDAYKYYVKGRMPEGWAALKYRRSDFSLALSFPAAQVPYFGVLPNEGGWRDYYSIFLEPCTSSFDRPDVARYRGEVATLGGHASYEWHLNIALSAGTGFRHVGEDGRLIP